MEKELKTPQQQIELFHLIFLSHLGERIDKNHYALKGGCNLRFYCKSIRYSEDIDLDVRTVAKETLKSQINKLLESISFRKVLQTRKIEITHINSSKQTDTTQRWKLIITGPASTLALPTKIEFSRRTMVDRFIFEAVDPQLISSYQLYPVLSNHYTLNSAFIQKLDALINRSETQARDIFDIHHLLDLGLTVSDLPAGIAKNLDKAFENSVFLSYSDYKSHVVAYLGHDYQEYYGSEEMWNKIQDRVLGTIEKLGQGNFKFGI